MPDPTSKKSKRSTPKLCYHKPTGQASVRVNGKPIYLGK